MWASTELIPHLSQLPSYGTWQGTLVNLQGEEQWKCGHAHTSVNTAQECAEYARHKRGYGQIW